MKAQLMPGANSSRAMKRRARFEKPVAASAAARVKAVPSDQSAMTGLNAASAFRAMPLSKTWHWPTRRPWLRPWGATPLHRARNGRLRKTGVTAIAARLLDVMTCATKPAPKAAASSRRRQKVVVNATHGGQNEAQNGEANALAVAMSNGTSATTALPHQSPARRLTVLMRRIRPSCPACPV